MRITATEVAHITSGRLIGADSVADGVSFDSRSVRSGELFVAISAERDGNDFVAAARDAGAAFAVVSLGRAVEGFPCVEVDDTTVALARLGREYRTRLSGSVDGRVIGITGSTGKTSTKNLVRAVLSQKFTRVHAAEHSLNNDIGVPVTILNAPADTDVLVLEMGMRGFHEIERLCSIATPAIGLITNIGDAHGERVGGAEGIARAKGELIVSLPSDGVAILNADDEWCSYLSSLASCRVITFGESRTSDMRWEVESVNDLGVVTARVFYSGEIATITPALPGVHMVANSAAAVLVGVSCGLSFQEAVRGIGTESTEFGRMVWWSRGSTQRILDDSYNANEASMIAAVRVLASAVGKNKIAVLGRMAEVTDVVGAHRTIAQLAHDAGIRVLALETDLYGTQSYSFEEVMNILDTEEWDTLLVKGSRAAATERVVVGLMRG